MKKYFIFSFCLFCYAIAWAQSVTISPTQTTIIDAQSTSQTARVPVMTSAQRVGIANPALGSMVYDSDYHTLYLFDGKNWSPLMFSGDPNQVPLIDRQPNDISTKPKAFGFSVAISGDYAIIGAPIDDVGDNERQGSAYIFFRNGGAWTQQAKLVATDETVGDWYGISVAIDGNYAVVGAPESTVGTTPNKGAAYVYVRSGTNWIRQAKIHDLESVGGTGYGLSVSISGDFILIGAPYSKVKEVTQGAAFVYVRNGGSWTAHAKLTAEDGGNGDSFGSSVCISGGYVIIGTPNAQIGTNAKQGAAYVFARSGSNWYLHKKLAMQYGLANDFFGSSVSLSGDYAMVSAVGRDEDSMNESGIVYMFTRSGSTWSSGFKLNDPTPEKGRKFGICTSIAGDYAMVGSYPNNRFTEWFLYKRTGTAWELVRQEKVQFTTHLGSVGNFLSITPSGTYIVGKADGERVSFGKIDHQ
jgi:hypothetical protein